MGADGGLRGYLVQCSYFASQEHEAEFDWLTLLTQPHVETNIAQDLRNSLRSVTDTHLMKG